MFLEKNHQAANRMMRLPGFCNLFCNGFADALDIGQLFRLRFNNYKGLIPKMAD